jgi:hypothetical protein
VPAGGEVRVEIAIGALPGRGLGPARTLSLSASFEREMPFARTPGQLDWVTRTRSVHANIRHLTFEGDLTVATIRSTPAQASVSSTAAARDELAGALRAQEAADRSGSVEGAPKQAGLEGFYEAPAEAWLLLPEAAGPHQGSDR